MLRRALPALTLAATVLLTGCGGDDESTAAPPSTAPAPTTASPTASDSPSSSATATPFAGTEVEVAVRNGEVQPPTRRVDVAQGDQVRLLITSDVVDEVHVHGYDIEQALPAGRQVTVDFTADQPGLFTVETHETHLELVQLEVR